MAIGVSVLVGCATTPFSQSARYDQGVVAAPGTITVSDLKLYSKEALINERAREAARLQKLIDGVDSVQFKPDFIRDTEQIRAWSFALGIRSDPAAELNYRRAQETADLQQEISALKLKAEFDQLRRDLELLRAKLPAQTEPVNTELGKSTSSAPAAVASSVTAPAVTDLIARVDAQLVALRTMLAADGKLPAPTTVTSSPFDEFRDRQAYLDMVRSARNAASLDELHDQSNASLIRLNLQATVIPEAAYPHSLGVVQVKIDPASFDEQAKSRFLSEWLDHINFQSGAHAADGSFALQSDARAFHRAGLLAILAVGKHEIALPAAALAGVNADTATVFADAGWGGNSSFGSSTNLISSWKDDPASRVPVFQALCEPSLQANLAQTMKGPHRNLMEHVHEARARLLTYDYARRVQPWLLAQGAGGGFASDVERQYAQAVTLLQQLKEVLPTIARCSDYVKTQLPARPPNMAWGDLTSRLGDAAQDGQVRIYEVGPREQVQQISSVARSANSLALAASIAAAAPGSGAAADAALGYAKQAMGRATTLERVPSVVGYAVGGQQTFGWVLGPRASLDPKGSLEMEQMLKPYDLSVDMSVPWWWPALKLKVSTQWGPSPHQLASGTISRSAATRDIEIRMSRRAPDYDWFSRRLLGMNDRLVRIDEVVGGPVNACSGSTLVVNGPNVWRAEKVMVLGQLLDSSSYTIAPDMRGILVNVPVMAPLAGGAEREPWLRVMTPFMSTAWKIDGKLYVGTPAGDECKPKKAEAAADPTKLVIEKTSPDFYFVVPGAFEIQVQGKNLDKVTKVTLHGQPAALKLTGKTTLNLRFTEAGTQSIPTSEAAKLEFYTSDGKSESIAHILPVRILNKKGN
ncbi:MAG: hypothetical protein ACN6OP_06400 [Pseudomonadales bacterium]